MGDKTWCDLIVPSTHSPERTEENRETRLW
jgi:hypothetical protein